MTDTVSYNRDAWNRRSNSRCRWSIPVDSRVIESARAGNWEVILTPNKSVPKTWFGEIKGKRVLCLASGGGQQAPVLAAAGAHVVSFDNSDEQLAKDKMVADRDQLDLKIVQGDMADLSVFADKSFDLIFHPVSNLYAERLEPVWRECHRVLKPMGRLLSGAMNPLFYLFNHDEAEKLGTLEVKYVQPFSDLKSLSADELDQLTRDHVAYEFGHSLEDQIGGQIAAGFSIAGFYEDDWDNEATPLNRYTPTYITTLAIKQG